MKQQFEHSKYQWSNFSQKEKILYILQMICGVAVAILGLITISSGNNELFKFLFLLLTATLFLQGLNIRRTSKKTSNFSFASGAFVFIISILAFFA